MNKREEYRKLKRKLKELNKNPGKNVLAINAISEEIAGLESELSKPKRRRTTPSKRK